MEDKRSVKKGDLVSLSIYWEGLQEQIKSKVLFVCDETNRIKLELLDDRFSGQVGYVSTSELTNPI